MKEHIILQSLLGAATVVRWTSHGFDDTPGLIRAQKEVL